ncbi:hypothetical protein C3E79_00555 [Corynebacterium liangguodongii]|uniref:Uncharacterized protein n=2 Tax=Corynebacterium liangguodongii TaxID=2079535 RepID=A0A2S0WBL9_9CORY|nr:hypothetical protein C3E79_00555 [Corynebacterium liangguodongii]PWB98755.1 hypothetical protein DF219_10015 [Corynebacterium liangguodongii]
MPLGDSWGITQHPGPGYVQISTRRYVPPESLRPDWAVELQAKLHPRGVRYAAPAAARALANAIEHPTSIITGYSALAVYGLPHLAEGHDTTLVAPVASNSIGGPCTPTVTRRGCKATEAWTVSVHGYPFRVASPAVATAQALKSLEQLPAVQLIDASRRHLGVSPEEIKLACRRRVSKRWVEKVLRLSSAHADSPKETEMRLMTVDIAADFNLTLREQHPLLLGTQLITVFDLALLEPKIGLMYDGQHHWEYQQRQKDSLINLEATAQGWTVLRFSAGTLPELPSRLRRLLAAVGG